MVPRPDTASHIIGLRFFQSAAIHLIELTRAENLFFASRLRRVRKMNPTTATITMDGLAICYFNKSSLRWEVRFPKEPGHKLTLKVNEYESDISNAQQIRIYTVLGDYPDYGGEFKGGCYDLGKVNRKKDPKPTTSRKKMRWAINLCDSKDVPPGHR